MTRPRESVGYPLTSAAGGIAPSPSGNGQTSSAATEVVNAFSVDVEDYFHDEAFRHLMGPAEWERLEQRVEPATRRLLALLDEFDVTGTFFVLGWVAERRRHLVADIHSAGHELAIHGYDHRPITVLSPGEFREDIRRAKGIVEDIIGEAILGYRAPTFSVIEETKWALDIMAEEGIRYDSSVFPIVHDRYGIPKADRHPHPTGARDQGLIEFPMPTVRIAGRNLPFAGGGYQRLLPMPYVRWAMRRVAIKEGRPVMIYVHPWEVDPGHPVLDVGAFARFRHYHGLGRVEDRLRELLSEHRFDTARRVLGI